MTTVVSADFPADYADLTDFAEIINRDFIHLGDLGVLAVKKSK